ncbi:hypothetical protein D9V41_02905 [Aeromicrobium phragmitis]|uniref:Ribulose 1,5-bisphosphate carboxylase large subunit n=1 Tax=Aeromicrobium phragmitis TaxID=2478914 RepID=A0A3L8PPJ4_9ACTN|nr:hypothetical protein [Aeromicrobium phragmitis]RLV56749.1 hypothetical protein D9V41_02905 [Aeromicrobium phragmitis]
MRLIPDPRDALALASRGPALAAELATALPRALALLDEAEALLARVSTMVDQVDATRTAADEIVRRAGETVDAADELVRRADKTAADADEIVRRSSATVDSANAIVVRTAGTVGSVEPTIKRTERLIDLFAPSLERLQPLLDRLATTTDTQEVDALVGLIDHLPHLLERVETEVIPMLANLQTIAPDIHDMLDLVQELGEMLGKVPGMGRIKRRADEQQGQRDEERDRVRLDSGDPAEGGQ